MRKINTPENIKQVLDLLPCTQAELWKKLGWRRNRMSRLIAYMEKENLIMRTMDDKIIGGTFHISKSKRSV